MTEPGPADVLREVESLHDEVEREGREISGRWRDWIERENFAASALNFAHYLAFRRRDIRPLQRRMMQFGLSSLGRAESRVLPTLDAVLNILRSAVAGAAFTQVASEEFFAGEARIAASAEELYVPVIWATQVLESYLKTGVPTRGEMTDAAMAARAECVMLNKGPYLFAGIEHLDLLLGA
jgi:hypothetical protein